MCMPQILIRKVIKLKAFSFFVPWVIVNLNQYISSLLVEICLWQIGKMVKCPICFLCERKKIIRVQVGILIILNLILKKTHRKYYSDSIRPAFFPETVKLNKLKFKWMQISLHAIFWSWIAVVIMIDWVLRHLPSVRIGQPSNGTCVSFAKLTNASAETDPLPEGWPV